MTFVSNFQSIVNTLNGQTEADAVIHIVPHTDSICSPCPHRDGKNCQTQEKITILDQAHARALDLSNKTTITWGEAKQAIKEKLTLAKFHDICRHCEWKKQGICESVLKQAGIK